MMYGYLFRDELSNLMKIVEEGISFDTPYFRVYRTTNEKLKDIFSDFDFKNKEVLSVMSSADQPFSAYYLGAKSVDTFDCNLTSYYYFYLKKWYIMHFKDVTVSDDPKKVIECLNSANPHSDEEMYVKRLWQYILNNSKSLNRLFNLEINDCNVPFSDDIDKLIEIIKRKTANFNYVDFFKQVNISKKYDTIIFSNILEYASLSDTPKEIIIDNISKLLKSGGICIFSNLINDFMIQDCNFVCESSKTTEEKIIDGKLVDVPLYYVYKKR